MRMRGLIFLHVEVCSVVIVVLELREWRGSRGWTLGGHLHYLLHVERSADGRPARIPLVIVVDTGAEVTVIAVVKRRPQKTAALWQHVASICCVAWINVVVHLLAFLPEHWSAVLECPGPRRNRVLTTRTNTVLTH